MFYLQIKHLAKIYLKLRFKFRKPGLYFVQTLVSQIKNFVFNLGFRETETWLRSKIAPRNQATNIVGALETENFITSFACNLETWFFDRASEKPGLCKAQTFKTLLKVKFIIEIR